MESQTNAEFRKVLEMYEVPEEILNNKIDKWIFIGHLANVAYHHHLREKEREESIRASVNKNVEQ